MVDFDEASHGANCCAVPGGRRKSGIVPRPQATPAHWVRLAAAYQLALIEVESVARETGDRDVRRLRDATAAVLEMALQRARAADEDA